MTKNNQTVQDKIIELKQLVDWFDGDDFSLEASIDQFKKAERLAKEIETDLKSLQNEITVVKKSFDEAD